MGRGCPSHQLPWQPQPGPGPCRLILSLSPATLLGLRSPSARFLLLLPLLAQVLADTLLKHQPGLHLPNLTPGCFPKIGLCPLTAKVPGPENPHARAIPAAGPRLPLLVQIGSTLHSWQICTPSGITIPGSLTLSPQGE